MSFRADDPPAAGAHRAAEEGVFDQGGSGSVEPDAPGSVEPDAPGSVEPHAPGSVEPGAQVDPPGAAVGEPSAPVQQLSAPVQHPSGPTLAGNMLPDREGRRFGLERLFVRVVATGGIVGIGVAIGAILAASNVQGWIIGLAVAVVSVLLSAVLWSSRQL